MRSLASDLKKMGFEPTGEESPHDEHGRVWSNGTELVCDKTATVIAGPWASKERLNGDSASMERHTYPKSGKVKMMGGYVSAYRDDDGQIRY